VDVYILGVFILGKKKKRKNKEMSKEERRQRYSRKKRRGKSKFDSRDYDFEERK
jgi:hypothetical protein